MSGKERILATVSGALTGRRAFLPTLSLYGAGLTGCPLDRYFCDPEAYFEGQRAVLECFTPDALLTPFVFAYEARAFGCRLKFYDDQPPVVVGPAFESAAELTRRGLPRIEDSRDLCFIREATALLSSSFGEATAIAAPRISAADLPALLLGAETWIGTLLTDPVAAGEVLEVTAGACARWGNALFEAGAMILVEPMGYITPRMVPQSLARSILLPAIESCCSRLAGPVIAHHCGHPLLGILTAVAGLSKVAGVVIDPTDDFAEARRLVGENLVLIAGPVGPALGDVSPEQVFFAAAAMLTEQRRDRRLAIGTAGADVPLRARKENILALRRAVWECEVEPAA